MFPREATIGRVRRPVIVAVAGAAVVAAFILGWIQVREEREFRRLIATGDVALANEQTFVAIEAFSGAVALKPASMLPYLKRGDTYRRRGEYEAALRDLRRAQTLDPTATRAIELIGDTYALMADHPRALEQYKAYLALDDRAAPVWYKLALAFYRKGDAASAIDPLRRGIALDEGFTEAHYLLGMSFRQLDNDPESLQSLRKAIELDASFAPARSELADLYASMGRTREEIDQIEALAAIEPVEADRLIALALAYARHGRSDAAILTLRNAMEKFPEVPAVRVALGRVWLQIADANEDASALRKAVEALQPAASRANATSETLTLFGRVLMMSGNTAEAERAFQQATTKLPVATGAFRGLADAASRLGHTDLARASMAQHVALAEVPPSP